MVAFLVTDDNLLLAISPQVKELRLRVKSRVRMGLHSLNLPVLGIQINLVFKGFT